MQNPRSTFAINGHPLHPIVVTFPIALFVSALATDIIFQSTKDPAWANGSYWLIVGGLVTAVVAATGGVIDYLGDKRIQRLNTATLHAGANVIVVLLEGSSLYYRHKHGPAGVVPLGLIMSLISTLLLVFSGWMGGELIYKHRVAVKD